ncbi:MAG: hypothetical protein OEW75_03260 [Cyclobacteriaceae bacterium]|nr:hypothetical protein [Cyclobacteriaceae bacterium]
MKKIIFTSLIVISITTLSTAQRYEHDAGSLNKLEVYNMYGNLEFKHSGLPKIEIELLRKGTIPKEFVGLEFTDERKENTYSNIGINVKVKGRTITVRPTGIQSKFNDYRIWVPQGFAVFYEGTFEEYPALRPLWEKGGIQNYIEHKMSFEGIQGEIEQNCYSCMLTFRNISGPITANVLYGNIEAHFKNYNKDLPSSLKTFSGKLNVYLPGQINCTVRFKSFSGMVNSEFDLTNATFYYQGMPVGDGTIKKGQPIIKPSIKVDEIRASINDGGGHLELRTVSGSVNLIKQND